MTESCDINLDFYKLTFSLIAKSNCIGCGGLSSGGEQCSNKSGNAGKGCMYYL